MANEYMRLGDMLVAAGLVARDQVDWALRKQKETGRRLGEELVELGFLTEVQLTQVLSNQLSVPWVSLYHVEFSRELLDLVPAEVADRYTAVPIYVRTVRREGDTLFVATADPTNDEALAAIRKTSGLPVKAMVAPPSEIRTAIRVYYFGGWRASSPPTQPGPIGAPANAPPAAAAPDEAETARRVVDAAAEDVSPPSGPRPAASSVAAPDAPGEEEDEHTQPVPGDQAAELRDAARRRTSNPPATGEGAHTDVDALAPRTDTSGVRSVPLPAPRRGPTRRMLTLTLLDGTVVRLPMKGAEAAEAPADDRGLTATDLVAALRARAEGTDVSDVLGDEGWEPLFAALLTLLIRKGLIADWEFVDEWRKRR